MKVFRLVLLLILLGTRMQTVKAVEEEISIRHEMDRIIEEVHVSHAGGSNRCKRRKFCERESEEGGDWQREKEETARERTQGSLKKTAEEEKWKKRKKRKRKKGRRRRKWWKNCKEFVVSLSLTRMKKRTK